MKTECSIVVPTYNRAAKVLKLLRALEDHAPADFEVVVVVDGSTDGTARILRESSFRFGAPRVVERENGGRAKARNTGAACASGRILLFFDDDMRPERHCVERHVGHHRAVPDSILAGSQLEEYRVMRTDVQRYRAAVSARTMGRLGAAKRLQERKSLFLFACNFSIPKDLFERLGGFDERLTDGEDFDVAARACKAGVQVFFDPEALAWHDDLITLRSHIERTRQYAESHRRLKLLRPELYSEFDERQARPVKAWKRPFFSFLARGFWVDTVDGFNWLRILPRFMRYRLYSYIIAGLGAYFPDRPISDDPGVPSRQS